MPVTVGGGVRSVDDARVLLNAGADKICLNTAAVRDPSLIARLADAFGSQCVCILVEAKEDPYNPGQYYCMADNAREPTGIRVCDWLEELQEWGAGEVLLISVDYDGSGAGMDYALLDQAVPLVNVPLVFSGGVSKPVDVKRGFERGADAIAVGSAFHYHYMAKRRNNKRAQLVEGNLEFLVGQRGGPPFAGCSISAVKKGSGVEVRRDDRTRGRARKTGR